MISTPEPAESVKKYGWGMKSPGVGYGKLRGREPSSAVHVCYTHCHVTANNVTSTLLHFCALGWERTEITIFSIANGEWMESSTLSALTEGANTGDLAEKWLHVVRWPFIWWVSCRTCQKLCLVLFFVAFSQLHQLTSQVASYSCGWMRALNVVILIKRNSMGKTFPMKYCEIILAETLLRSPWDQLWRNLTAYLLLHELEVWRVASAYNSLPC